MWGMAQELWLLRHGDAEPHGTRPDWERPLTAKGEEQSRAAGQALAALGFAPALVLASPRVRAWDTAQLACAALDAEPEEDRALSGGYDREDALAALARLGADDTLLLVGHEPDLSQLVWDLAAGRVGMKKGGVAGLRVGRGAGELLALLRPADLRGMAGGGG